MLKMLEEFNSAFNIKTCADGHALNEFNMNKLRHDLAAEELKETYIAANTNDTIEVADGLVDQLYILLGSIKHYNLSPEFIEEALVEVHRSNMSKLKDGKPIYREDGKILKGPDYSPPKLTSIYKKHYPEN